MPFTLLIAEGAGRGRRFRFARESVAIGRGPENDVVLNDGAVSRAHARIERRGGGGSGGAGGDRCRPGDGGARPPQAGGAADRSAEPVRRLESIRGGADAARSVGRGGAAPREGGAGHRAVRARTGGAVPQVGLQ